MRTCAFVIHDGFQLLDLAGPLEVFRTATLLGASPGYRTVVATATGMPATTESGVRVAADTSLTRLRRNRTPIDTLVVVGGIGTRALARDRGAVRDVAALARSARRTTSVCTGAFVLAAAGLLDGRRATTHWASCAELAAAHPAVDVQPDPIFVRDGDVWTSAGVTAGVDLALALVDDDHGVDLAHQVAGWLVVFTRRPGGQAQFSAQLLAHPARTPAIAALQQWLPDHLDEDLSVEALARRAAMSPRTFARAFRNETGTTPAAYVEALRVEAARRLLEAGDLTVAAVAAAVGLRHAETLYRAFRRRVGTTPDDYRRHFTHRAS
ncbi:MAG TPA: GlxA family transcriptional regulator [Acidimicrobiales bacterium]|nr:GlxA family transcriptional regulator [Acidimicrobiales bacterium]